MPEKKKSKFDQVKYITDYSREHYKKVQLTFSKEKDKDIIEKLETVPNKSNYVKELIREDLKKHNAQ